MRLYVLSSLASVGLLLAGAGQARAPLSATELAQCAQWVAQLQTVSPQLLQRSDAIAATRQQIEAERRAQQTQSVRLRDDDLEQGLSLFEQREALNQRAIALNRQLKTLREDIAANSQVRDQYDATCSGRPYARQDLEALPDAQRQAMRRGLGHVQVPYLPDQLSPLPGVDSPQ